MAKVVVMCTHPISNPKGPQSADGKVHEFDDELTNIESVAQLASKVWNGLVRFNGKSNRVIDGRAVVFPGKYTAGVHAVWLRPATALEIERGTAIETEE